MLVTSSKYLSSQKTNLSLGIEKLPGLQISYFEGASLDAREKEQPSEDFLCYQYEHGGLYFVLCDGVQQTIDASLASRLLGTSLLNVLPNAEGDKKIIESFVEDLRLTIDEKLLGTPLDKNDPFFEFNVRARTEIGAHVKFACGVIDFVRGMIELYWAGDVRFVLYGKNANILFSWEEDNKQFWSSRGEYAVQLSTKVWKLDDVSRLSITSDGIRENFKDILDKKVFLNNTRLINHRYKIGVDDISGVDIQLVLSDDSDQLPQLQDVKLVNNSSLVWSRVSKAERYRVYCFQNKLVEFIEEVESRQNSYILPENLPSGDFCIQALSSHLVSSKLSNLVFYTRDLIPEVSDVEPVQPLQSKGPEPAIVTSVPAPVLKPGRSWRWVAIGFMLLIIVVSFIIFAPLKNLIAHPYVTDVSVRFTSTPFMSTTAAVATSQLTSLPSFTPSITSTFSTPTPVASETPSLTLLINENLNDCQNKIMNDEPNLWTIYQIQRDDTFYRLSRAYNTTVEELMRVNCYSTSTLLVGNFILVPIVK